MVHETSNSTPLGLPPLDQRLTPFKHDVSSSDLENIVSSTDSHRPMIAVTDPTAAHAATDIDAAVHPEPNVDADVDVDDFSLSGSTSQLHSSRRDLVPAAVVTAPRPFPLDPSDSGAIGTSSSCLQAPLQPHYYHHDPSPPSAGSGPDGVDGSLVITITTSIGTHSTVDADAGVDADGGIHGAVYPALDHDVDNLSLSDSTGRLRPSRQRLIHAVIDRTSSILLLNPLESVDLETASSTLPAPPQQHLHHHNPSSPSADPSVESVDGLEDVATDPTEYRIEEPAIYPDVGPTPEDYPFDRGDDRSDTERPDGEISHQQPPSSESSRSGDGTTVAKSTDRSSVTARAEEAADDDGDDGHVQDFFIFDVDHDLAGIGAWTDAVR